MSAAPACCAGRARRARRSRRRDSESSRKLADDGHAFARGEPRSDRPPCRPPAAPRCTSRGSKWPGPVSTKTSCRVPVSRTAESGTTTPSAASAPSSTLTNIPGLSARVGFANSSRTLSVRRLGVERRVDEVDRGPRTVVRASYGSVTVARAPRLRRGGLRLVHLGDDPDPRQVGHRQQFHARLDPLPGHDVLAGDEPGERRLEDDRPLRGRRFLEAADELRPARRTARGGGAPRSPGPHRRAGLPAARTSRTPRRCGARG